MFPQVILSLWGKKIIGGHQKEENLKKKKEKEVEVEKQIKKRMQHMCIFKIS